MASKGIEKNASIQQEADSTLEQQRLLEINSSIRQQIDLTLEQQRLRKIQKNLNDDLNESSSTASISSSSTTRKRISPRLADRQTKKVKTYKTPDSIKLPNQFCNVGSNLLTLADSIVVTGSKSNYFYGLSKNNIIDIDDDSIGSQLKLLNTSKKAKVLNQKFRSNFTNDSFDFSHITNINKIKNIKSLRKHLKEVEVFFPQNKKDRILKKLLYSILDFHSNEPKKMMNDYWKRCSEQSLIVKFWGYLFEVFFGYDDSETFLQWGDTLSLEHKNMDGMTIRLDLRIIISRMNDEGSLEVGTGEFASALTINNTKLYKDKLKSVLVSKAHLNNIIKNMKNATPAAIKNIKIPLVQIMGATCYVYSLSLVDKKLYCMQEVCSFVYPRSYLGIENGSLHDMLNCMAKIKSMLEDVRDMQMKYSQDTSSDMEKLYGKKKPPKPFNYDEYISEVINVLATDIQDDNDYNEPETDYFYDKKTDDSTEEADDNE
ncbi:hypothetical protein INT45_000971 [Circinella minor]|uniref:Uncharacterized protein n=1 Tax=Circinella minor TaxID=1195481 RepID=A0A8H7VKU2_9FUNG|nr:hypothetical protein INT45_000971 [Circinella minor]